LAIVTQPLRDEHRELLPELEILLEAARAADSPALPALLAGTIEFLRGHLIPHAQAEEAALYPVVARLMGAPAATATMSRDHVEVVRLTGQLTELQARWTGSAAAAFEARRLLLGLYALLQVHFAKEEEIYLPLLDEKLPADEASAMFTAMESAAAVAKERTQGPA
jgi:iron-sulfur cluster repair protein YtfE (RIC family)